MRLEFYVTPSVRDEIKKHELNQENEDIVIRCVSGYTRGKPYRKTEYLFREIVSNFSDWKKSESLLKIQPIEDFPSYSIAINKIVKQLKGLRELIRMNTLELSNGDSSLF